MSSPTPLALSDLREKILRPVALANFLADPLRAIRAARFAALFPDFTVHEDLLSAMRGVTPQSLGRVAAERVGQEVLKACAAPAPGNFLRILRAGQALDPWLAEFQGADLVPAGPPLFHEASVLEHTARVMDGSFGDTLGVWMALCRDRRQDGDSGTAASPRARSRRGHGPKSGRALASTEPFLPRGTSGRAVAHGCRALRGSAARDRVRLLLLMDKAG